MRILLLSAYDAVSHRMWREGLVSAFPEHEWQVYTMPSRHFSWRIRGNPLNFIFNEKLGNECYDLIIASSMVDLAVLKGLSSSLALTPTLLYFHENQFGYPVSKSAQNSVEPSMVNLYSALSADRVCFNSEFNRDSFFGGIHSLFKKLPDFAPLEVLDVLRAKSYVVPVPLMDDVFEPDIHALPELPVSRQRALVWNHRWEYDKGPERFYRVLQALPDIADFKVHVLGQRFSKEPACMKDIKQLLVDRNWMGQWGPIEGREEYLALLCKSTVVLSTALHDFQGLSVLEGMAKGCLPAVPNRLAYPEFVPDRYRYLSADSDKAKDLESEAQSSAEKIQELLGLDGVNRKIKDFSWKRLKPLYAQHMSETVDLHQRR